MNLDFRPEQQTCVADPNLPINAVNDECSAILARSAQVLQYGKIEDSECNRRQLLCDRFEEILGPHQSVCLHAIFGKQLEHFVCRAQIVVIEHSFNSSALETHRIDPLLQAGKTIVVTRSEDLYLDRIYAKVIHLTPRVYVLHKLQEVRHIYGLDRAAISKPKSGHVGKSEANRQKYVANQAEAIKKFVKKQTNTIDPICYAFRSLEEDTLRKEGRSSMETVFAQ